MKTSIVCLAVSLLGFATGFTQDEFDPLGEDAESSLPKMVRIQVEFIEVPQETMTALLSVPKKSADDTDLRAKLQELMKAGEAKMLESQLVIGKSGQKCTSESIHEFIYPTEYEPPATPVKEGEKDASPAPPKNPAIPTAFDTRDTGSLLEVEPVIGQSGMIIDLRFQSELVYHTGNETWQEVTEGKDTYRIQMPNFYKISTNTTVTLITGQPLLAAAASPKNDKGEADFSKKILIFVRADVLTVGR